MARLLQLGLALVGLSVLGLLLVPWIQGLSQISCTPETERAGECILGLHERGLFGAAAYVCMVGAAFAFVLRKGVFDFPAMPVSVAEAEREGGVGDADTKLEPRKSAVEPKKDPPKQEPPPKEDPPPEEAPPSKDAPGPEDAPPSKQVSEPGVPVEVAERPSARHRRLEGPVYRAFVESRAVELDEAIMTAAQRLRSDRVAVVFSRGASEDANLALLELAETLGASRYVLEGTAAAAEGIPKADKPDPHAADEIAGPDARHAGELALNLAGSFIQTVFLLDTRVLFPEFVLGKLTELQSVCIAHAHDDVSATCQVVLPGTNLGEREGELVDSAGGPNSRRARAWLVKQIVEALRTLESTPGDAPSATEPTTTEP